MVVFAHHIVRAQLCSQRLERDTFTYLLVLFKIFFNVRFCQTNFHLFYF